MNIRVEVNGKLYNLTNLLRLRKMPNGHLMLEQGLSPVAENGTPPSQDITWASVPVVEEPQQSAIVAPSGKPFLRPV